MAATSLIVAPSILAADFAHLADEARAVEGAADWLHVDVMDNHFVPNLTIGLPVVQRLRGATTLPLDCHLMIDAPDRWALGYAEAGADAFVAGTAVYRADNPADVVRRMRRLAADAVADAIGDG